MRELTATEIFGVGGADGLTFTTPLTLRVLNNVANMAPITKYASAAFGAGYAIGTFLNTYFNLSTKIVDALTD